MNYPSENDNPQHSEAWRSDVYPGYGQASAGSSSLLEENLAALRAQDKANRRFAFAGLMCGCFSGLPLILVLVIELPQPAWVISAWLGPPIAVGGIVFSVLGLRSSEQENGETRVARLNLHVRTDAGPCSTPSPVSKVSEAWTSFLFTQLATLAHLYPQRRCDGYRATTLPQAQD